MAAKIKQKNPGWLKKLQSRYKKSKVIAVGYPLGSEGASASYPDGTPLLLVAAANNFGAPSRGIPARDFMTQGGVRALEKTAPIMKSLVKNLNKGKMTVDDILEQMGPVAVAEFQQTIIDISDPANTDKTIELKGSSNPLVDTGLLNQTLTYVIRSE